MQKLIKKIVDFSRSKKQSAEFLEFIDKKIMPNEFLHVLCKFYNKHFRNIKTIIAKEKKPSFD